MALIRYFSNGCTILSSTLQASVADGDKVYTVGWHSYYGSWWYANTSNGGTGGVGTYYINGWELIDGGWYYFDTNGYVDYTYMQTITGADRVSYGVGEQRFRRTFFQETKDNNFSAIIKVDHDKSWEANKVKIIKNDIDITNSCYNSSTRQITITTIDQPIDIFAGASLKIHLNDYFAFSTDQYTINTKVGNQTSNSIVYN